MIVKCEQCQTRFKIPDEKVTEKGVKVRCTKCGNTFRVTRESASPSSASSIATAQSAVFAPASTPSGTADDPFSQFGSPVGPPDGEATRRASFPLGQEASRVPDLGPAAVPHAASVPAPPTVPAQARAAPQSSAPFDFGSLTPPGVSAPPAAPAAQAAPFDFAAMSPPAGAPPPAAAAPFDFAALGPPPPGPSAAPVPAPAGGAAPAFDFSAFSGAPAGAPPPAAPPPAAPPPAAAPPAAGTPAFDFSAFSGDAAPPAGAKAPPAAPPGPAFPGGSPAASADDFFSSALPSAAADPEPTPGLSSPDAGGPSLADLPSDPRALFDMPAAPPPSAEPDPGAAAPAPVAAPIAPQRMAPVAAEAPQGPSAERLKGYGRRPAIAIVVNVVIAVVLVVALVVVTNAYLNEGRLDAKAFSPDRLLALVSPPGDLVATDITNGLYDTHIGKPVFYVRGEVHNRGAHAMRALVRAELVEGGNMVRSAEVIAGAPPTPEQLYGLGSPDDLERLVAIQSMKATKVAPEGSAPFVITFFEYPPDLKAFRVRVTVVPEGEGGTAAR